MILVLNGIRTVKSDNRHMINIEKHSTIVINDEQSYRIIVFIQGTEILFNGAKSDEKLSVNV